MLSGPLPPSSDPVGEPEWPRICRDFWEAIGSGQAGLALLVIGVFAAAAAAWVAQENNLDVLATAEWAVGMGIGIPFAFATVVFFRVAFRVPKSQRDEARAAYQRQKEAAEANLVLDLEDGVVFNEVERGALLQLIVKARNMGTRDAPVHDWRAVLRFGDERRQLEHVVGGRRLLNSHLVPALDRVGPLPAGLTAGYLHFVVPGVSQQRLNEMLEKTAEPVDLTLTAYGPVQQWQGELDLRAKWKESHTTSAAQVPAERLRSLSREGHRLKAEIPKSATPAGLARYEPRIDRLAGRARELLFEQWPQYLSELDAIAAYRPASLNDAPAADDPGRADVFLERLLALVDRILQNG